MDFSAAKVRGKQSQFVTTLLETFSPDVPAEQTSDLLAGQLNSELSVILAGRCQQSARFLRIGFTIYNPPMPLVDQIQKDIVTAMKSKDEARLSTLRMVKSALQLKTVEKMSPLDDRESQAVLATLIKQRKESVEQFTKGGRQEMADKESAEIVVIESYLPKAAGEAEIVAGVKAAIAEMGAPTMKEMGTVMKNAMAKFNAAGMRVDGKVVSEIVKKELAGK
jgi:uncharacterized protein YqeY